MRWQNLEKNTTDTVIFSGKTMYVFNTKVIDDAYKPSSPYTGEDYKLQHPVTGYHIEARSVQDAIKKLIQYAHEIKLIADHVDRFDVSDGRATNYDVEGYFHGTSLRAIIEFPDGIQPYDSEQKYNDDLSEIDKEMDELLGKAVYS